MSMREADNSDLPKTRRKRASERPGTVARNAPAEPGNSHLCQAKNHVNRARSDVELEKFQANNAIPGAARFRRAEEGRKLCG